MATIAVGRIKKEFQEVIKSDEVRDVGLLWVGHFCARRDTRRQSTQFVLTTGFCAVKKLPKHVICGQSATEMLTSSLQTGLGLSHTDSMGVGKMRPVRLRPVRLGPRVICV